MKKVESFIGVDGVHRDWEQIENQYFNSLMVGPGRYQSPLQKLEALRHDHYFASENEHAMLKYLIDNFEKIIKAKPVQLTEIIQRFKDNNWQELLFEGAEGLLSKVGHRILDALSYRTLRYHRLVKLASIQNIKSCLYCNSQFTLVIHRNNRPLAKFQYDHFYPKMKYPYLSISLYNLIPSCSSCNQSKSETDFSLSELVHPFYEDFHELAHFSINRKAHLKLLMGATVTESDIKITLSNLDNPKVNNQNTFTAIQGIYERHTDIVIEIYKKAYAYKKGGKEALINLEHEGDKIFASEDEIEWLLLANYTHVSDINKRPLSKFMQDIAGEAGLINKKI